MDGASFRRHGHALVDWVADYLERSERYPVLARVQPGDIRRTIPTEPPQTPEAFEDIFSDFERLIVPGLTHWNHPGFFGYFAISASPPGVLAELLSAALNQQGMLWRTSPAATELEEATLDWLRQMIGLPGSFEGVIHDTASVGTMHALAAARAAAVPSARSRGLAGNPDVPRLRVYASEQAHSSVDKSLVAIGLGLESLRKIRVDDAFRLNPVALKEGIAEDRAAGILPMAVVATVGTTSTTSIDPVPVIADICAREGVWLHVDAAYGGAAALLPSHAGVLAGADRADSVVVNPHKWLLVPFDLSALFCRRMDLLRSTFALTPDYLQAPEGGAVRNLSDTGVALGRRFRALKLWFVLRAYGVSGLREVLARHVELARELAGWIDEHGEFERLAPVPFSVVCFRWNPADRALLPQALDEANQKLLDLVNGSGAVFLSHTRLDGRFVLRMAIGHLRTEREHVRLAWDLLCHHAKALLSPHA